MSYFISKNVERLSLHDSFIEGIKRNNSEIVIELSHGYLSDFNENGVNEAIVFGDAVLTIFDVIRENYWSSKVHEKFLQSIEKPLYFDKAYQLITKNSSSGGPDTHTLTVGVLKNEYDTGDYFYVVWDIVYHNIRIEWHRHVLHKNWLDGTAQI